MNEKEKRKLVFIGGVHGVGKTTFCQEVTSSFPVNHISASELIRKEKIEQESSNKKVKNISENQDILIRAINRLTDKRSWYIIDGHFCLLDSNEKIVQIPFEIFSDMNPEAIVIIHDDPAEICKRLNQRDKVRYSESFVERFQSQEIEYARIVAESLNIPHILCKLEEGKQEGYVFLKNLLEGR
ncbi:ATP-binding protein [Nodosilinea sp. FACHB-13]|uniref:ATP-binding protein n=1 Tax=Cyanophyceae TaxID=3028117 RepID=UPI00168224AF|nr:ATP-binding protein [Nodosilinea sp. FACHB-13]MBD2105529.1 AAA family ATPase [Nodosilinea sp. FACHB-13]